MVENKAKVSQTTEENQIAAVVVTGVDGAAPSAP